MGEPTNSSLQADEAADRANKPGLSRRGILNIMKGFGAGIGAAVILGRDTIVAFAQQITGVLGSPSATTTIDGNQLPPPPPKFGGVIKESAKDSKPWWPPRVVPPNGAPNVLLIMTDDQGYGVSGTFGGVIPTPALDRIANAGLRYTQFHSTALCSPTRAALITGRNHHEVGFGVISELSTGYPGYDSYIGPENATIGTILRENGYATSWFGKNHNTPGFQYARRPLRSMAVGDGLRIFLRLHGRRDRPVDALSVPRSHADFSVGRQARLQPHHRHGGRGDRAHGRLDATAPDKPFFVYYVPGGSHSPHQPKQEWIDKFKGKFDMGWNAMRDEIFANQKRLGVVPANAQLPNGRTACRSGKRCRPTRRSCLPGRRRCSPPTRPIPTTRSAASSRRSRIWASSTTR